MSYPQALHTSCRNGLSGHAGFQFNAASSGLDEGQLARIAAAHAGYRTPPDAPAEPSAEEIASLPVSLRYLPVEGVGPVVSRTVYVGREFRGTGAEPDSGRFGNYFSHILVGAGDGEPFGGLFPIELWQAPHWSTSEIEENELAPLEEIEPGPLDLARVLGLLAPRRAAALGAIADAALAAVLGGPRLVLVEPDPELAAAWVAWACFALPPDRAGELTFSTFDGRPRLADSVRLCVTTPACDVDFPPYELGSAVRVIDAAAPPAAAELSLYGRAIGEFAGAGDEAVGTVLRNLPPGLGGAEAAAAIAVAARRTDLARAEESPAVVAALRDALERVPAASIAEMAAALPAGAEAAEGWTDLYAAARRGDGLDAGAVVDEALGRLLDSFPELPAELPPIPPDSPNPPSAGVLVRWLEMVSVAAGSERLGPVVSAGSRLGLVGCNTALDKELAATIAAGLGDPGVREAYDSIAAKGVERVVEGVALELAAAAAAGDLDLDLLAYVAADPVAREAVRRRAEEEAGDFEAIAGWELLRVRSEPGRRAGAVTALAARAQTREDEQTVRGLYGAAGPTSPIEHAELLEGWSAAGRAAPALDFQGALACLAELRLEDHDLAAPLMRPLADGPPETRADPTHRLWRLVLEPPPGHRSWSEWAGEMAHLLEEALELPRRRREEAARLVADTAVACLGERDHLEGVEQAVGRLGRDWPLALGEALAARIDRAADPARLVAEAFARWAGSRRCREALLGTALPRATRDLSAHDLEEVGERCGERLPGWDAWLERHPPRRAVTRRVRGVLRRREGR